MGSEDAFFQPPRHNKPTLTWVDLFVLWLLTVCVLGAGIALGYALFAPSTNTKQQWTDAGHGEIFIDAGSSSFDLPPDAPFVRVTCYYTENRISCVKE